MAEIHKWKACLGCGHPQHSRECREMVMPGLPGDVDECGCVELTNINDIIDLCRRSGGCPKHPIPEPPGSTSSSPDEPVAIPCGDCKPYLLNACKAFEKCIVAHTPPADAEIAEEPERLDPDCIRPTGCRDKLKRGCARGCAQAADDLTRLSEEMEAPPPRPPNAVAYATEGGAQFEIALSGDATVRAIDGALIITHASAVLAITQVRPMET